MVSADISFLPLERFCQNDVLFFKILEENLESMYRLSIDINRFRRKFMKQFRFEGLKELTLVGRLIES